MSIVALLGEAAALLIEHADVIGDVVEAIAEGHPKEAIRAAVRGVRAQASRDALAEEFAAAGDRRKANHGPVAYAAYCAKVGGKTWDGRDCPTWDALTDKIREAWEAGADAAREA